MKAAAMPADVDAYIAGFPTEIRARLERVRATIRKAAPEATEKISYRIPTFVLHGNLVHFAAFARHIGFYPGSKAIVAFAKDLKGYETSKGTIQLPLDRPLPLALIRRIVQYRVRDNLPKAGTASRRRTSR